MSTFIFTHRAPKNFTGSPEGAAAVRAWFEHFGANLMARTDRALETSTLGNCSNDTDPFAYTLVTADSPEAAVALAREWPLLARGGGLEVRELTSSLP
jgi:hypothetical protein